MTRPWASSSITAESIRFVSWKRQSGPAVAGVPPVVVRSTIAMRRLSSITCSVWISFVTGEVIVPPSRLRNVSQPPT